MTEPNEPSQPTGLTPEQEAARAAARAGKPPITPPPAGGPEDPSERTVTPIAHPTVVLPPNPRAPRRAGAREIIIGVLGLIALGSTFLNWESAPSHTAWASGLWIGGVVGVIAAGVHIGRYLPPADKAFGALLPLMLATGAVWVPVAHLRGHVGTVGTWVCLAAGVLMVYLLLVAAMTDPALRSADKTGDFFD